MLLTAHPDNYNEMKSVFKAELARMITRNGGIGFCLCMNGCTYWSVNIYDDEIEG